MIERCFLQHGQPCHFLDYNKLEFLPAKLICSILRLILYSYRHNIPMNVIQYSLIKQLL